MLLPGSALNDVTLVPDQYSLWNLVQSHRLSAPVLWNGMENIFIAYLAHIYLGIYGSRLPTISPILENHRIGSRVKEIIRSWFPVFHYAKFFEWIPC